MRANTEGGTAGPSRTHLDNMLSSWHTYVIMQGAIGRDDVVTDLILTVFRLNGRLIETGNRLVEGVGLTTAWWQVLGALALSPTPLPVASIARNMGLSRQSVQRTADLLAERGLVRFEPNPHHQRAKLVVLTTEGIAVTEAADDRQRPFGRDMMAAVGPGRLAMALDVLTQIDLHLARVAEAAGQDAEQEDAA